MKGVIFLLLTILVCKPFVYSQALSFAAPIKPTTYYPVSFTDYKPERKLCTLTQTGLIAFTSGILISGASIVLLYGTQESLALRLDIASVAGGIAIAGLGMAIGGGIHDIVGASRRHRLKIISSKGNQIGFALTLNKQK